MLADIGEKYHFGLDIQILKAVDSALWEKDNVITTDSIILDHCLGWFNLMKICVGRCGAKKLRVWEYMAAFFARRSVQNELSFGYSRRYFTKISS